jgi:predicted phage tail component-like protein
MMYEFCDTNRIPAGAALPSEALCYDGVWPDEDISLYRTLYVSGRESFSADIAETPLESMDGSIFLRRRLLPRTIMVGYQITASSAAELMTAYNRLNRIMSGIQVPVSFADEPDKYYVGTCRSIGAPEPGRLSVKAEMEIYCADPCKYAVEEKTVHPNSGGLFAIEYAGSYPVHPSFTAAFSGSAKQVMFTGVNAVVTAGDADASTAAFMNGDDLLIDCGEAEIYLNDEAAPGLGDIANQYEDMLLLPGPNIITPSWTGTAPTVRMKYREAWL